MKTQLDRIYAKAVSQNLTVIEGKNRHGNRKLEIDINGHTLNVWGDENEKFSAVTTKQGMTGLRTMTSVLRVLEPRKEYGIVKEIEGDQPAVGTGGTLPRYTDADPVTVVEVINPKKIVVRYDAAELDKDWKPDMHVGGFSAHTSNNYSQKWNIKQDEDGALETYTLRNNGRWVLEGDNQQGQRLVLGDRVKFHDYNF